MSVPYRAVVYTSQKLFHDGAMLASMAAYIFVFLLISLSGSPRPDLVETLTALTRATGTMAVVMLHFVLAIGPLSRLHPAFTTFIRNRRHMGVATFFVALAHACLVLLTNYTGGAMNPIAGALLGNGQVLSLSTFPFEIFGFAALLILAAMALTSHDFWIAYLGLERWKRLHMLVYAAYLLVMLHVGFGTLQSVINPVYPVLMAIGACVVTWLHWAAAQQEHQRDLAVPEADAEGWLRVCAPGEIPENRAVVVSTGTERVAVFRHWQGVSAISNVCVHQGGPIGEGEVIAGFARCPWHGSIYSPLNGTSPPPLEKTVPTYNLKLRDGVLYLDPRPNPLGTPVEPVAKPERRRGGTQTPGTPQEPGIPTSSRSRRAAEFFVEGDAG